MWRVVNRVRGISVRLQVAIGVALAVMLTTLAFALLITYASQQGINSAKEDRLRLTQTMAARLDDLLRRSDDPLVRLPELLLLSDESPPLASKVVDDQGNVIAAYPAEAVDGVESHMPLIGDLVRERRAGARIHRGSDGSHIIAYSPLESIPGGLLIEEREDEILSLPLQLLRILPFFGLGVLLVASASAWFHAWYVVHPLRKLRDATARIASGMIDEPITTTRRDEIGRLAQSFEAMRTQLKAASEARNWWEGELERRVRERTAEVHHLVGRTIYAQEEERRRLAQELHDDTAQAVASLLMGIEALRDSLPPDQKRVRRHIDRTISQGSRALGDLRRVILGLRPAAVDDMGLVAAVRSYAGAQLGPSGIHLDFAVQGKEQRLPEAREAALYRMLQEAVNNIARHAKAQNVGIRLDFQDAQLVATVEDDGQGFDLAQVQARGRGLGLEGMRERADIINARLEVTSAPGQGTKVRVTLPLGGALDG
ncbi:MAG: ATP-binding protein [Dehalococcoidia bacterium]